MSISLKNSYIDKYFSFLLKLDSVSKKRLIVRLTESMNTDDNEKIDLKNLFGSWKDNRTSDQIIKEIRDTRIEKSDSVNLE